MINYIQCIYEYIHYYLEVDSSIRGCKFNLAVSGDPSKPAPV